ncbi:methionyl-tRNA formyltransferase [Mucilaginibacter sp. McL0603]|uniref:methionyl-tRNA formyltransferase n=1 Tax=Mucilaginibacter sp. McL0603 TaxID=3415670 RepID=UPI003CE7B128
MKLSLLMSGNLGFESLKTLYKTNHITFIATDSKSDAIITFARDNHIPLFTGNPRKGRLYEFASKFENEILFSINYLYLLEKDVIDLFRYPINFHGSLLPKYRGRTPHVWAIINNEKKCGITAHFIDTGCDTGDMVLQETIEISDEDTGNDILSKYMNSYSYIINKVLILIENNNVCRIRQNDQLATYFGKRTADDGEIDWNWQKERIRNWVRAQAYPYPGAFTFIDKQKIVIDKLEYSELGYNNDIPNGSIIQVNPFIVIKTSNGAVKLTQIRNYEKELFLKGKVLGNENRQLQH